MPITLTDYWKKLKEELEQYDNKLQDIEKVDLEYSKAYIKAKKMTELGASLEGLSSLLDMRSVGQEVEQLAQKFDPVKLEIKSDVMLGLAVIYLSHLRRYADVYSDKYVLNTYIQAEKKNALKNALTLEKKISEYQEKNEKKKEEDRALSPEKELQPLSEKKTILDKTNGQSASPLRIEVSSPKDSREKPTLALPTSPTAPVEIKKQAEKLEYGEIMSFDFDKLEEEGDEVLVRVEHSDPECDAKIKKCLIEVKSLNKGLSKSLKTFITQYFQLNYPEVIVQEDEEFLNRLQIKGISIQNMLLREIARLCKEQIETQERAFVLRLEAISLLQTADCSPVVVGAKRGGTGAVSPPAKPIKFKKSPEEMQKEAKILKESIELHPVHIRFLQIFDRLFNLTMEHERLLFEYWQDLAKCQLGREYVQTLRRLSQKLHKMLDHFKKEKLLLEPKEAEVPNPPSFYAFLEQIEELSGKARGFYSILAPLIEARFKGVKANVCELPAASCLQMYKPGPASPPSKPASTPDKKENLQKKPSIPFSPTSALP